MKIEPDAVLVCTACGVEGSHELLYLSDHVSASRCENCGAVRMFTGQLYADYARDVAERGLRLPCSLAVRCSATRGGAWWPHQDRKEPSALEGVGPGLRRSTGYTVAIVGTRPFQNGATQNRGSGMGEGLCWA